MNPLLIFDFDGTLVDTAPDLVSATNELFSELGFPPLSDEQVKINIGQGLTELLTSILPHDRNTEKHRAELVGRFLEIYEQHYLRSPQLYEGLEEILYEWPHPKAILSNKSEHFLHGILKQLGLDSLPWVAIVGGNTFKTKKPDPEGLLHVLARGQRRLEEAVLIGDGNPDADLAQITGIRYLAVDFGYGNAEELLRRGGRTARRLSHYKDLATTA